MNVKPCLVCILPEIKQVNQVARQYKARGEKVPLSKIFDWLVDECGADPRLLSPRHLGDHFYSRHHVLSSVTRAG